MSAAAGVAAALVLGAVYAYGTNWIPFIYLNFLLTIGFGLAVAAAVEWGARVGKMRNTAVATMVAAVVGLIAVYFAWVFDPMARVDIVDRPIWDLQVLWQYMKLGFQNGFWGIGENGPPVTGWMLVGVWATEAIVIVTVVVLVVRRMLGNRPFCEETNQWTKSEKGVALLSLVGDVDIDAKLSRLVQGELDALSEFYRGAAAEPATLRLDLATCPGCPTCNFLTAKLVRLVENKRGKTTPQEQTLWQNLQIAPEDVAKVRSAGVERPAAPPPAEATTEG